MDDLVRSKEKSSPDKEERQEEFELEQQCDKFKKKRAARAQVEAGTPLIEETGEPVEGGIDNTPFVRINYTLSISHQYGCQCM